MINFASIGRSGSGAYGLYLMSGTGVDMGLLQEVLEAVRWGDMSPAIEAFEADQLGRVQDEIVRIEQRMGTVPGDPEGRMADIDRLIKLRAMVADPERAVIYAAGWERLTRAMDAARSPEWRANYPIQLRGDTSPELLKLLKIGDVALDRMTITHLLRNRTADGGAIPGKYYSVDRRGSEPTGFFSLTFSPGKSVSMASERGDVERRAAIIAAHNAAVEVVMRGIERDIGWVRSGRGGINRDRGATTWVVFRHGVSRMGDPDLHSHVAMLNVVLRNDGKVGSLDTRRLHGRSPMHREMYHEELAEGLTKAGFDAYFTREGGYPEAIIRGLHLDAKREFSQRHEIAVKKAREWAPNLEQLPAKVRSALVHKAALATRPGVGEHRGGEEVWAKKWEMLEAKWARERISEANRALGRIKVGLEQGYNVGGSRDLEWGMER